MVRATFLITLVLLFSLIVLDIFLAPEPAAVWSRTVPRGQSVADVVCLLCSVSVDGEVDGDLVTVLGNIALNGTVNGDVVAVGGTIRLGAESQVTNDLVAVGGEILVQPGARWSKEPESLPYLHLPGQRTFLHAGFPIALGAHFLVVFLTAVLTRPRRLSSVGEAMARKPWKSLLTGTVFAILWFFLPQSEWGEWLTLVYAPILVVAWMVGYASFSTLLGWLVLKRDDNFWLKLLAGGIVLFALLCMPTIGGLFWTVLSLGCLGGPVLVVASWVAAGRKSRVKHKEE